MTRLTGQERATYVQNMFTRIARRYDLMNRLMTGGQDSRWRKQVIQRARLGNQTRLLDLGWVTCLCLYFSVLPRLQGLIMYRPALSRLRLGG